MHSRPALLLASLSLAFLGCVADVEEEPIDLARCDMTTYRVVAAEVPLSAVSAADMAIDIDGDGDNDNALGGALAAMLSVYESAQGLPALVNERLQTEDAAWFITLGRCRDDQVLVWSQRGADDDGDGVFTLGERTSAPSRGSFDASGVSARDGNLGAFPAGLFADPLGTADEVWTQGVGLTAELEFDGQALVGRIGLGFTEDYFDTVARPLAAFFTARAAAGTSEFAVEIDEDGDGEVSLSEMRASPLIQALLLNPDLDLLLGGSYRPSTDERADTTSFSLYVRAEPVELE